MSSSKSTQIGLFLFAILSLSVNSEMLTYPEPPYTCYKAGETRVWTPYYHEVYGTGIEAKCDSVLRECEDRCKSQGRIMTWSICQWKIYQPLYACTACCGLAASPPPPRPPPPSLPPPPPRDPRDRCSAGETSFSRPVTDCKCYTGSDCDSECAVMGSKRTKFGCNRFFYNCCCSKTTLSSSTTALGSSSFTAGQ